MGRSFAALLVLVTVGGCTVQAGDGDGDGDGDGKQRSPVRIELPSSEPPATADDNKGDSDKKGKNKPGAATKAPPPAVLWSRGDSGRDVRELQARLRQVAWLFDGPTGTYDDLTEQAVKGFQGKRGLPRTGETDTVTWQRLLRMTHEPGKWDLYLMGGQPAAAPDPRCLTGRVLCIDKTSRTLRWMIDGRTVSTMAVRFGSQYTPTREGVFSVYWKSRHHVSTLYDSPMPYAMFFSGGQAVHYSSDFAARGYAGASHGCVNVRDERAIAELYAQVRDGDKVVVYW
ncbi:L,D-transpeptidase family protein [Streptomyces sp. NL15-2K]|uniref:L,D-transpeptidase family protein n=1 Tax=Streptomyces sp. NL15-2K TaxID=376149 RepID=UPI000F5842B1|nr:MULTISPECIES: L,D-transpeptidase family protein [Actinomycetes]WKX11992.1 L,D-transpeptidase family protein [Kutzneria buriramensis]GCB46527.1 erfK/ybiS/ycfS/ynhG family protein [Streptomyces sp. NL15-2K]